MTAEAVYEVIRKKAGWQGDQRPTDGEPITEKQAPFVASLMSAACKPSSGLLSSKEIDDRRHAILAYLVGVDSTNALSKKEASAIIDWLSEPGTADLNEYANSEAASVYAAWQAEQGQAALSLNI